MSHPPPSCSSSPPSCFCSPQAFFKYLCTPFSVAHVARSSQRCKMNSVSCEIRSVRVGKTEGATVKGKGLYGSRRSAIWRGKWRCRSRAWGCVCLEGHVERTGRACLLWIHITRDLQREGMAAARKNQLRHVSSAVALVACLCDKENVNNWHKNYLNLGVVQIRLTSCHAETGAFHSHRLKSTFSSAVRGRRRAQMHHALRVGRGALVFCLWEAREWGGGRVNDSARERLKSWQASRSDASLLKCRLWFEVSLVLVPIIPCMI